MELGRDIAPYHDRQIVILERAAWTDWLDLSVPAAQSLIRPPLGLRRRHAGSPREVAACNMPWWIGNGASPFLVAEARAFCCPWQHRQHGYERLRAFVLSSYFDDVSRFRRGAPFCGKGSLDG